MKHKNKENYLSIASRKFDDSQTIRHVLVLFFLPVLSNYTISFGDYFVSFIVQIYYYTGDWDPETVADFVRIEKLVLFGDYLCGIETPVLSYNIDQAVYESVIQRESSERLQDKRVDVKANIIQNTSDISLENEKKRQLELTSVSGNHIIYNNYIGMILNSLYLLVSCQLLTASKHNFIYLLEHIIIGKKGTEYYIIIILLL